MGRIRSNPDYLLGAVIHYHHNKFRVVRIEGVVGVDAVVIPPVEIDGKMDPFHWDMDRLIGIICCAEKTSVEDVRRAIELSESYHLNTIELWYLPELHEKVRHIRSALPAEISDKVKLMNLGEFYDLEHTIPVVILAPGSKRLEKDDEEICWDLMIIVRDYGLVQVAVQETLVTRAEHIFELMKGYGDYHVKEIKRAEKAVLYVVRKFPKRDVKLKDLGDLSQDKRKRIEAKIVKDRRIVVDATGATKEDEKLLKEALSEAIQKIRLKEREPLRDTHKINGKKSLARGIAVQRQVINELLANGLNIKYSFKRRKPDIVKLGNGKVVEVIAIKSYSLQVSDRRGCRNVKGHKYAVSFKPSRDALAEYRYAVKNGLDKIRLICFNLKTGNKIYDGYVGLNQTVTLRDFRK